jgi:hypothetical protein
MRKLTTLEVRDKLKFLYGDSVILDCETYINTHTKAKFVDKQFGEWWAFPYDILYSKKGHPERAKQKRKDTCFIKYGVDCLLRDRELMKKGMFDRYGVTHPMHDAEIKHRVEETCVSRYGVKNPTLNIVIANKVKNKLRKLHHDFPEISLKSAISCNKINFCLHWESGKKIPCRGSYEQKTVDWLNGGQVAFMWQPKTFCMPDGRNYTPDLYLVKEDVWVEIKGYFWGDAREKWDWFHKVYSNSELWNEKRLKNLKIL